ncbi:MAG: hypothetical protein M0Q51_12890 [Bacteroidales bacterium]|nr:hypothetical protein [Bacteroidales bacterium]
MQQEFIRIEEWPTEHAQRAYNTGNFIEALQTLHGWIENKLRELLILAGTIDYKSEMSGIWDISNQISLVTSAHVLFILSQLSENEYQMIIKFNGIRNDVIHKIYRDPYEEIYKGIPKERYDEAFNIGMELSEILQRKTDMKIDNNGL